MSDNRPHPEARKRSEARQRTAMIALRLLPREREALAAAAHARHVSLSELIRAGALQNLEGAGQSAEPSSVRDEPGI